MKKYRFTQLVHPDPDGVRIHTRMYKVYLGSGACYEFRSKRRAQDFATRYAKRVNEILATFNMILGDLYQSYRGAWFYFFDHRTGANATTKEEKILQAIRDSERLLHLAVFHCEGSYSAGRIWTVITQAEKGLRYALEQLAGFYTQRRLYAQGQELRIMARQASGLCVALQADYQLP